MQSSLRQARAVLPRRFQATYSSSASAGRRPTARSAWAFASFAVALPLAYWASRPTLNLDEARQAGKVAAPAQGGLHPIKARPDHQASSSELQLYSRDDIKNRSEDDRTWVIINDEVWDVSDFLDRHPGGSDIILSNASKDVTRLFKPIHPPGTLQANEGQPEGITKVGRVPALAPSEAEGQLSDEERSIKEARENMPHIDEMVNLDDFEKVCKAILTKKAWAYYSSGSDDEKALATNKSSFDRVLFKPRVLRKVAKVSTDTTILGHPTSLPIYIAPAALARLGHEDGEMNLTRGAGETDIIQCISSNASCSLDEMCSVRKPDQTLFWQYYVNSNRDLAQQALQAALDHKMDSIWVTVDAPVGGRREADLRVSLEENPPVKGVKQVKGASTSEKMFSFVDPDLCWEDLKWIKKRAPNCSLVIKGVGCVEDAVLAIEAGCDGVVLSNHGGRQLSGGVPPIRVLEELRRKHGDLLDSSKAEIFVDGGIRRGTDVLKALCLGASAVGLGRTFLFAQSAYGTEGVVKAVDLMRAEVELGMRLLGVTNIDQLGSEYVELLPQ